MCSRVKLTNRQRHLSAVSSTCCSVTRAQVLESGCSAGWMTDASLAAALPVIGGVFLVALSLASTRVQNHTELAGRGWPHTAPGPRPPRPAAAPPFARVLIHRHLTDEGHTGAPFMFGSNYSLLLDRWRCILATRRALVLLPDRWRKSCLLGTRENTYNTIIPAFLVYR